MYDALLVIALLMVATLFFLPFTDGEAITPDRSGNLERVYQLAWVAIIVGFFGVCWTRGGQTLGMAAWRLRIEREDGQRLTWSDALKRLGSACLSWIPVGIGFLWILIDREHLAWHDRLSRTRIVLEPKRTKP